MLLQQQILKLDFELRDTNKFVGLLIKNWSLLRKWFS